MVAVVRSDEVTPQPWANGGGTTLELAVAEDGAWRVSLADVDRDGPFSTFPGRRRLLTVVDGPVLRLVVDGAESVVEPRRPFAFDGGAEALASVPEGPVRVLNVIADPDHEEHAGQLEWAGGSFDPAVVDLQALTRAVDSVAKKGARKQSPPRKRTK